ncbi:MAG: restriction endonuclease [Armatimonadetes bacterium]|nr:restriction endonuclease [Armatimonadota bacterium]
MMQLSMRDYLVGCYKNKAQLVRHMSERWGEDNLYCPACDSGSLISTANNTPAVDFHCPGCTSRFQLKSGATWSESRVPDAGYDAMMRALRSDAVPNLMVMQYAPDWSVRKLLLVPSFFFSPSCIEKRKPLSPSARRAGWVGCNILLSSIADIGKLEMVQDGLVSDPSRVRDRYRILSPLAGREVEARGWTLDVLNMIRHREWQSFSLEDAYTLEPALSGLYPANRNVRPKIRQQLQVLRDMGLIRFLGGGRYVFVDALP